MRGRGIIIAGLMLALLLAGSARAETLPRSFWGVFTFDPPTAQDAHLIHETGIGSVRTVFNWRGTEPSAPNLLGLRNYDWERTDARVRTLAHKGVETYAVLLGTPAWLTDDYAVTPMRSAEGRSGWEAFVRAVAERYGRGGTFWAQNPGLPRVPVRTFQIWNEQNSGSRYKPTPNPEEYAGLLRIASTEIRGVDPGARIVLGGMFGTPNNIGKAAGSMPAWDFLERLYATGAGPQFDAVAAHPYSPNLRGVRYQIRRIRNVMATAGDGEKPLEITEIGWSSGRSDAFFFFAGLKGQALNLRDSFRVLIRKRQEWRIERIVWHGWRDTERRHGCGYCQKFGLLKLNLARKPSYRFYRQFATGLR